MELLQKYGLDFQTGRISYIYCYQPLALKWTMMQLNYEQWVLPHTTYVTGILHNQQLLSFKGNFQLFSLEKFCKMFRNKVLFSDFREDFVEESEKYGSGITNSS